MIGNVIAAVRIVPLAIFLFAAVVGSVVALIGSLAGSPEVTELGKLAASVGALGFVGWFCLPIVLRSL